MEDSEHTKVVQSFHALNKNIKRKADRNLLSAEKASRSPNIALSKIKKLTINLRGEDLKLPLSTKGIHRSAADSFFFSPV